MESVCHRCFWLVAVDRSHAYSAGARTQISLERGSWWRVVPVHLVACLLIAGAHFAIFTYASDLFSPFGPPREPRSFWETFLGRATSQFHIDLLIYAATLGVSYAVSYYLRLSRARISRVAIGKLNWHRRSFKP